MTYRSIARRFWIFDHEFVDPDASAQDAVEGRCVYSGRVVRSSNPDMVDAMLMAFAGYQIAKRPLFPDVGS